MKDKGKNPTKQKRRTRKVCSSCGAENALNRADCGECGKVRFEPDWVVAKRPINRQLSVQVTKSNPEFGDVQERITLSKWWPGGRATFHLPHQEQWDRIAEIIQSDLGPRLGWKATEDLVHEIKTEAKKSEADRDLTDIVRGGSGVLKQIVTAIDPAKISPKDFEALTQTLGEISDVATTANAGFREAFLSVVNKLPKQRQRALEDLDLLLQGWSLSVVTNVAQQVRGRLETIELFEKQVQDPRTFELKGENSIHRILERAMWLVDERYWLLFSNSTLRKQIGDAMSRQDKKRFGKKRPDFVCGTVDERLIILELKRPGHTLGVEDLNQLETYITVAEKYFKFRSYDGYLVGSKVGDEVRQRMKHRSRSFHVLPFSNLISDTKKRYHGFLESIDR